MINNMQPREVSFTKQVNTRDFYKGTSFRWCGDWEPGKLYSNDAYFIDYVAYDNSLWVCTKSHYASESAAPCEHSAHWQNAVAPGPEGKPGLSALHVGPNPPTYEEYGDNYTNMLWLDTSVVNSDQTMRVYSKNEVDSKFYTKEQSDIRFVSKDLLDDKNYATKKDLEKYGTKEYILGVMSGWVPEDGKDVPDFKDYYTKDDINNFFQPKGNYLTSIPQEFLTESEIESRDAVVSKAVEQVNARVNTIFKILAEAGYNVPGEEIDGSEW